MDRRFRLTWTVKQENQGQILRDFLAGKDISKRALTDIKYNGGQILVNDREENVRYTIKMADRIELIFPREIPSDGMKGEHLPLSIVFEDDYVLVTVKPAGMNTIPSREHPTGSLANALIGYYERQGIEATVHIVTRLDRDTSGLVLIAKHRHIHHLLSEMQKRRLISRSYTALASGIFSNTKGIIEQPIGRKETSIIEREVRADGQYACTKYKVLAQYETFAQVRLKLETGRTHQIRVHLSHVGHPLLGDDLYGGPMEKIRRQALHCSDLAFRHPITHEDMQFHLPFPADLQQVLNSES
ncbi:RluA family pseudouridine synthase [Bacillus sp. REN10]|uniref:RluA family pseudouridine synthase n=1 Tax=Bacillus sp. REN10 TaxID=2782541 RepID=UPI00193B1DA9|nr:RluA family pseudouridine synthase [Bacillus sp. REN10]